MDFENIFSEDEEYEDFFHKLYDGSTKNTTPKTDEKEVSLFGMSAIFRDSTNSKLKEDVFIRSFDAPARSIVPYEDGFYPHNTEIVKKNSLGSNYAFFGMRQLHMTVEKPVVQHDSLRAERERMLKNIEQQEERQSQMSSNNDYDDEHSIEHSPKSSSSKRCHTGSRKLASKKRKVACDDYDSNEDDNFEVKEPINEKSEVKTRKRRSSVKVNGENKKTPIIKRRRRQIGIDSSSEEDEPRSPSRSTDHK